MGACTGVSGCCILLQTQMFCLDLHVSGGDGARVCSFPAAGVGLRWRVHKGEWLLLYHRADCTVGSSGWGWGIVCSIPAVSAEDVMTGSLV
jgi:hypothetical protein